MMTTLRLDNCFTNDAIGSKLLGATRVLNNKRSTSGSSLVDSLTAATNQNRECWACSSFFILMLEYSYTC